MIIKAWEGEHSYIGTKFLYTTEIKLLVTQTKLSEVKVLMIIIRTITEKITQKYTVEETRDLK